MTTITRRPSDLATLRAMTKYDRVARYATGFGAVGLGVVLGLHPFDIVRCVLGVAIYLAVIAIHSWCSASVSQTFIDGLMSEDTR